MPIINGKKRYIPERNAGGPQGAGPGPAGVNPQLSSGPTVAKKRYQRAQVQEEKAPRVMKRYKDGGGTTMTAAITQDTGNFVGGYEFTVQFSLGKISFSKIGNIGGKIEVGTFVEGGNNDYPMIYKTPRREPDILVLQKGVADSAAANLLLSQLKEGTKVMSILIFVKRNGSTVKTFSITEGIIISRRYSNLDAVSSSIFVEQLEIAHTGISEV